MRFRPKALILTIAWPWVGVGLGMEAMRRAVAGPVPLVMSAGVRLVGRGLDGMRTYQLLALSP